MNLKAATLFAIIGASLKIGLVCYSIIETLQYIGKSHEITLVNLSEITFYSILLLFFIIIFKNQKTNTNGRKS